MPLETIILIAVAAFVLLSVSGAFLVSRRRGRDLELDPNPPPITGRAGTTTLERPTQDLDAQPTDLDTPGLDTPSDADVIELDVQPEPEAPVVKPSFFERLVKARGAFTGYLGGLVGLSKVGDDEWEELEEALIRADVGVKTSMKLIEDVRTEAKETKAEDGAAVLQLLKARMHTELAGKDRSLRIDEGETNVWLFVGVNGVGKTTTIGKLGKRLLAEGHRPLMAAGDTFRAAAADQLGMWAERSGSAFIRGAEGGDPSSVIFDGVAAAAARDCDVVLADTAGRLHNKSNLMDELSKVRRVAAKEPGHVTEVFLVLDATTGQNGMNQAKVFTEAVEVTGVVLTKLDGSAKGGVVFAIESELGLPVKLVGLGEGVDDLVDFEPTEFVDALFE